MENIIAIMILSESNVGSNKHKNAINPASAKHMGITIRSSLTCLFILCLHKIFISQPKSLFDLSNINKSEPITCYKFLVRSFHKNGAGNELKYRV